MSSVYGHHWIALSTEKQWELISLIRSTEDTEELRKALITDFEVSAETADALCMYLLQRATGAWVKPRPEVS